VSRTWRRGANVEKSFDVKWVFLLRAAKKAGNSLRRRNVVTLLAIVGHIYRLDSLNLVPPAHDLTTSPTVTGPEEHQ
jgi:hypothetical protein